MFKNLGLMFLSILISAFAKRPNVLFIVVDDLKTSLKCYGDKEAHTPGIDKLASNSFFFKNAFAQQALCAPSRNSFLTSRRPDSLHLYDFYSYWRHTVGNFTTLPQHFKENGYYTHSVGKVFHPGKSSNFTDDYPYSWSTKTFHPKTEAFMNAKVCIGKDGERHRNLVCPVIPSYQPGGTLPDMESFEEAVKFLTNKDKITGNKPYFLAVGFHKPHIPLKFPRSYLKYHPIENVSLPTNRRRPTSLPTVAWNPWTDLRIRDDIKQLNVSFPFGPMPDGIIKNIKQAYYASVTYIDDLVGNLMLHVDKDTIVVLTSDHGWSIGEHGEFAKYSNFDVATRVPLLLRVPGLSTSQVMVEMPVELVDLFPSLVDLTQVSGSLQTCSEKTSEKLCTEGKSLVPFMVKKKAYKKLPSLSSFSQYPRPSIFPTWVPNSDRPRLQDIKIMGYSLRTEQYRYTEWVDFSKETFKPDWNIVYGSELYDHAIDPSENNNLVDREDLKNISNCLRNKLILGWRHA